MDVQNFIKSFSAQNNKEHTKFENLYIQKNGENLERMAVRSFIQYYVYEEQFDIVGKLNTINSDWKLVAEEFTKRIEKIFGYAYNLPIIAYLTTNSRCTYNIQEGYFFLYLNSQTTNLVIMHELFHFYTWYVFKDTTINSIKYNDFKEALTELLNVEFSDLLGGCKDKGYVQHEELRSTIRELWIEHRNLLTVVNCLNIAA